jgi:hypothetical protein
LKLEHSLSARQRWVIVHGRGVGNEASMRRRAAEPI